MMKCKKRLEVKALNSMAGFYIGTENQDGPYCRLSDEYYKSRVKAEEALVNRTFTVRNAPENMFCSGGRCEIA